MGLNQAWPDTDFYSMRGGSMKMVLAADSAIRHAAFPPRTGPMLFFDDRCSVCRRFIAMVVAADRRGELRIAPLIGARADALRRRYPEFNGGKSALWLPAEGPPVGYTDAILGVLHYLGGGWRILARLAGLVPRPIRNWAYRTFADHRNRFGWLGLAELDRESRARLISDFEPWERSHAAY